MTKYILHSGATGIDNENNKRFYQSWNTSTRSETPKILLCYYAREDHEYDWLEQSDKERLAKYTKNAPASFTVADKDPDTFLKQLKESDLLYVSGGNPYKVVERFQPIRDQIVSHLKNKVYAGSSAGVMAISQFSRSHEELEWTQGLALVPLISFVHYDPDNREHVKSVEQFKSAHPNLKHEYFLIPETEFVVREY